MNWARAHWWVGTLTLLVFPLTGAYMRHTAMVPSLEAIPRLIFRSRHLFLLLAAVANLALSGSITVRPIQRVAATLVLVAPLLLGAAFVLDPARGLHSSSVFRFSMYGLFVAGVLLAIANRPRG